MYFPYLRGKQYELIALCELTPILIQNNIIPIIEPVKANINGLVKAIENYNEPQNGLIIIINPSVGDWSNQHTKLIENLNSISRRQPLTSTLPPIYYGILLNEVMDISNITELINKLQDHRIAFLHNGFKYKDEIIDLISDLNDTKNEVKFNIFFDDKQRTLYRKSFAKLEIARVIIKNSFTVQKNALYPIEEFFSELHAVYSSELGMNGFGDFQIVGDQYSEKGGPAYAVAIHLTYISEDEEMFVKHFKSNDNSTSRDPGGKFFQALEKLIEFDLSNPSILYQSTGLNEFKKLHREKHFPGLGVVKKLSIIHHIELINNYLQES